MELMKELKTYAEQVEVLSLQNDTTTVEFEANKLKSSKVAETQGTAVRVLRDGKLGFAAASGTGTEKKLMENALESAEYGDQVEMCFPENLPSQPVAIHDPKIVSLPVARLVEIGREILSLIQPVEPEARTNVSLERSLQSVNLSNQTGMQVAYQRSPLSISVDISRIEGDDFLTLFDVLGVTQWEEDYLAFVHRLVEKLINARTLTSLRSGNMPVLFSPSGVLALGIPLLEGLNGKNEYKGTSPIAGKVGERLFDSKITVVDDGTLDGRFASAPYDDEGVPHRRNVFVEQGVLKGFMYDIKTAAQSGAISTGNAARSLFAPPSPAPTNLILQPGETPLAEIIAGIDEGLLVDDLLGIGQGNVMSGAFSNPVSLGFKIEKGEIVGRVKDLSIAGNIYDLLKDVAALSRESQWVYNNLSLPYLLLPEMNVVGKE